VATYILGWNYPGCWEHELLDAYGIERDEERIQYYRRLWDAT
jgi:kanamycin kinase